MKLNSPEEAILYLKQDTFKPVPETSGPGFGDPSDSVHSGAPVIDQEYRAKNGQIIWKYHWSDESDVPLWVQSDGSKYQDDEDIEALASMIRSL